MPGVVRIKLNLHKIFADQSDKDVSVTGTVVNVFSECVDVTREEAFRGTDESRCLTTPHLPAEGKGGRKIEYQDF